MKLKLRPKTAPKNTLTPTDILLMAMLNFPMGAVGEHTIHTFVKEVVKTQPFKDLESELSFIEIDGLPFSPALHTAIKENCRDVSHINPNVTNSSGETTAMFSDDLRFDMYDEMVKIEAGYKKLLTEYNPKVFWLSAMGRSVAILSLRERLTQEQKDELSKIAKIYSME